MEIIVSNSEISICSSYSLHGYLLQELAFSLYELFRYFFIYWSTVCKAYTPNCTAAILGKKSLIFWIIQKLSFLTLYFKMKSSVQGLNIPGGSFFMSARYRYCVLTLYLYVFSCLKESIFVYSLLLSFQVSHVKTAKHKRPI